MQKKKKTTFLEEKNQLIKTDTDVRTSKDVKIVIITVFHTFKNFSKNMNIIKGPNRASIDEHYNF